MGLGLGVVLGLIVAAPARANVETWSKLAFDVCVPALLAGQSPREIYGAGAMDLPEDYYPFWQFNHSHAAEADREMWTDPSRTYLLMRADMLGAQAERCEVKTALLKIDRPPKPAEDAAYLNAFAQWAAVAVSTGWSRLPVCAEGRKTTWRDGLTRAEAGAEITILYHGRGRVLALTGGPGSTCISGEGFQ